MSAASTEDHTYLTCSVCDIKHWELLVTFYLTGLNTSPLWAMCLHNVDQRVTSSVFPSIPTA